MQIPGTSPLRLAIQVWHLRVMRGRCRSVCAFCGNSADRCLRARGRSERGARFFVGAWKICQIDAIIDIGAAISAMTRSLMKELGYKINRSSDVVIVTADGTKSRSLGKIVDMELTLNGVDTIVTVQVIESKDRTLILGNDWLKKVKAQIDMDKGKINIKGKEGYINIPVEFFVMKDEDYEEEYEDEELREVNY